jgi:hypothetical protein
MDRVPRALHDTNNFVIGTLNAAIVKQKLLTAEHISLPFLLIRNPQREPTSAK